MASRTIWKCYDRCTNTELAQIAHERGITVPSLSDPPRKQLLKRDYLAALKTADAGPSFPFMDFSPELRNRVYQELLVLDNSFTCFPQILATSKQVNSEASTVLYGDNLIDVRMLPDGIYVHGKHVGGYASYRRGQPAPQLRLVWPYWLRKVHFLRFSLEHILGARYAYSLFSLASGSRFDIEDLDFVLHSMCSFLASDHMLRSLKVDITGDDTEGTLPIVPHLLQSTQLLGHLKELEFQGDIANFDYAPSVTQNVDDALTVAWAKLVALGGNRPSALPWWRSDAANVPTKAAGHRRALDTLPDDDKPGYMRKSILDLNKASRELAASLYRTVKTHPSHADGDKYIRTATRLTEFIRSSIELEAAEHQVVRDELKQSVEDAS
ncbi:unnamed protein product [Zymoseptoria tritici ST99CH_1A5]|uniref:Uncharacterized protein n=1 Tax=Zymoseptoria tritici ST99CH_1A5 TaxID=1276529 RepID=A0A1Y6LML6_ZYMTR|nr:unnamed protein product [Zymoseptoria tritici ST99CH_1A5]